MNRISRIASIIGRRKPLAHKVEKVEANLKILKDNLSKMEGTMDCLFNQIEDLTIQGRF